MIVAAMAATAIASASPAAAVAATDGGAGQRSPRLELIVEPQRGYGPIDALLASARHRLDLTMYELADPTAEATLAADASRGVDVRVLLDRDYLDAANDAAFAYLASHGVHVKWASNQVAITHEKSFVVDGALAVVMTGNLTSRYYATTRDFAVVDRDRSDVAAIEGVFQLDWADQAGTPGRGSDLVWSPGSEQPLLSLIDSAQRSLLIENEEMAAVPVVSALEAAARRGVDVKVIMTRSSEWYEAFDALARAGVRVHTFGPDGSLYIHAKAIVVDDSRAFVGSENFSVESMQYNRELGLVTTDRPIVGQVTETLEADYAEAQPWRP
jgi:cardiolipin synthase